MLLSMAADALAQNRSVTVVRGAGSTPSVEWPASGTRTAQAVPTTGWAPTKVRSTIVIPQLSPSESPTMSSPMQSSRYGAVLRAVGGNRDEAARRLGISRKTIDRKCAAWNA